MFFKGIIPFSNPVCLCNHEVCLPREAMLCPEPSCRTEVLPHVERCHVCGADVGFPNVRAADDPSEVNALAKRLADARVAAKARGSGAMLEDFGAAVFGSYTVLARSLGDLDAFIKSDRALYISYHSQVRAGSRTPENNDWDAGRMAAESTVHPTYFEKINYSALSLDGLGVCWWGEYSIVLKSAHLARRTSVFEENPFLFCERHRVIAGKRPPVGFRASWPSRQDLAMAKLGDKLDSRTASSEFASILLNQGTSGGNADFIECHIFGPLHRSSIEKVTGPRPKSKHDLVIWKSVVSQPTKLGVVVKEV